MMASGVSTRPPGLRERSRALVMVIVRGKGGQVQRIEHAEAHAGLVRIAAARRIERQRHVLADELGQTALGGDEGEAIAAHDDGVRAA